jgi:CubicO group peptidase (beta-lactamase class C family)
MKNFTLLLFVFSALTIFGQEKDFQSIVKKYSESQNFNGVVLVASEGKPVFIGCIGIADRVANTPISNQSKFRIASVTKTFTAVIILKLYEEGKIDLKATIEKYYPSYPGEAKDKVTIEQLLTYSSGIPDSADSTGMKPYQVKRSIDDYIAQYCSGNLSFVPGTSSNYSNTDYIILTKIIENITHRPFQKVLHDYILTPLNMSNSDMIYDGIKIENLVQNYLVDSVGVVTPEERYYAENYFGAGAMYSTAEDLMKFDRAIFDGTLLKESTLKLMIAPNDELGGVAFGVWYAGGYGIFDRPFIYRTGGIQGACSNWIHTIEDNRTIIVLSNTNATNLYELSGNLYELAK